MSCFSSFVVPLVSFTASLAAQDAAVVRKLNAPFDVELAGDVRYDRLSPDGLWAVYFADVDEDEAFDLFSVSTDGSSAPHELAGPLTAGVAAAQVSPDSTQVVYSGERDLFVVPIDGSAPPVALTALPSFAAVRTFLISADSSQALFLADPEQLARTELFVVPLDGSAQPLRLSQPVGASPVDGLWLDPAGGAALYTMLLGQASCLFRVPLAGGPPVQLTQDGVFEQHLAITNDGRHALYYSRDGGTYYLSSVPLDGSTAPLVIASENWFADQLELELSSDSTRVVYSFDGAALYSAPVDGSAPSSLITELMVSDFRITADSTRVVYRQYDQHFLERGLAIRAIDASQPDVRLDVSHTVQEFALDPAFAVFRASTPDVGSPPGAEQIFVVPLDGSLAPVRLDADADDVTSFTLAADGQRVAYTKDGTLFLTPTSAATPPVLLASRAATPLFAAADVVFDAVNDEQANELFSVPLTGGTPLQLSQPFTDLITTVDVRRFAADGPWVAFQVGQGDAEDELWCARLDAPGSAFRIEGPPIRNPGSVELPWTVAISASAGRLVYEALPDHRLYAVELGVSPVAELLPGSPLPGADGAVPFVMNPSGTHVVYLDTPGRLRAVATDGTGSSDVLAPSCEFGFEITPDGERVVFRGLDADDIRLYSVPMDASAPPVQLSPPANRNVAEFHVSADGGDVAFVMGGLYGARTDGSVPAVHLGPIRIGLGRPRNVGLTAAGTVVFTKGTPEDLYAVPVDGSAPPIRLSRAIAGVPLEQFELTSDGARVVYITDQGSGRKIHSAPLDGSAEPLQLGTQMPAPLPVPLFQISPDGERVVFCGPFLRVFSARVDLALSSVRLRPADSASGFQILPGSNGVLFTCLEQRKLSSPLVAGGNVVTGQPVPTPYGILYVADADEDEVFELYLSTPTPRNIAAVEPPH